MLHYKYSHLIFQFTHTPDLHTVALGLYALLYTHYQLIPRGLHRRGYYGPPCWWLRKWRTEKLKTGLVPHGQNPNPGGRLHTHKNSATLWKCFVVEPPPADTLIQSSDIEHIPCTTTELNSREQLFIGKILTNKESSYRLSPKAIWWNLPLSSN